MQTDITHEIKPVGNHYEVYIDGKFYCTADTYGEALAEVKEYLNERR